jgi:hypothetical protein
MKRLFDSKQPWITLSKVSFPFSTGVNHDKLAESINLLEPEMIPVLNKVLGYYEAAMESTNPYVKILLLVSCVESLIKTRFSVKGELSGKDLVRYLDKIRITNKISKRNFNQFINKMIYGKRSASAHGNIDINSNSTINVVQKEYQKFHQIVDTYIEDFLDKHKSSIV